MTNQISMPELRCYMNWLALDELPLPGGRLRAIRDAGYMGVQFIEPLIRRLLMKHCRSASAYAVAVA